jgi:hypothetical protein
VTLLKFLRKCCCAWAALLAALVMGHLFNDDMNVSVHVKGMTEEFAGNKHFSSSTNLHDQQLLDSLGGAALAAGGNESSGPISCKKADHRQLGTRGRISNSVSLLEEAPPTNVESTCLNYDYTKVDDVLLITGICPADDATLVLVLKNTCEKVFYEQ